MHLAGNGSEGEACIPGSRFLLVLAILLLGSTAAVGQSCFTSDELDAPTRSALESAGRQYFDWTAKGDVASIRQNAIPSVAADFSGIEAAIKDSQENFSGGQATVRPPFLLKAEGKEALPRAEFLCGVFGRTGQTGNSAVFVIPNLPPGDYGIVIVDITAKNPAALSLVLQKMGTEWKLGGYYSRQKVLAGHDGAWFRGQAQTFKKKGENHNAWLYYVKARDLLAPLPFMSTLETDKLYDEMQSSQPPDVPSNESPLELSGGGKVYKVTTMFPVGVGNDLDLVIRYQSASVANTAQTYQDNVAAIHALVTKYPEFKDGFAAIIARAVEPSGKDYGTLLAVKDIK